MLYKRKENAVAIIQSMSALVKPCRVGDITKCLHLNGFYMSRGNQHNIISVLNREGYLTREKQVVDGTQSRISCYVHTLTSKGHCVAMSGIIEDLLKDNRALSETDRLSPLIRVPEIYMQFFKLLQNRGPSSRELNERRQVHIKYDNEGLTY